MIIVGRDYHPSLQQIAFVDTETGERKEQRLMHREGAEKVYRTLAAMGQRVCAGMEASPIGANFSLFPCLRLLLDHSKASSAAALHRHRAFSRFDFGLESRQSATLRCCHCLSIAVRNER